jgi:RNA polymerase sigma-70 factor (ECF subfamily)
MDTADSPSCPPPPSGACTVSSRGSPDLAARLHRYREALFRYALQRVRNEAAAEDLVQETFLAALQNMGCYEGRSSEKSWLTGILKHKISDHFRRGSRESRAIVAKEDVPEDGGCRRGVRQNTELRIHGWRSEPEGHFEQKQFWASLRCALERLPPRYALIYRLRELEGREAADICAAMQISRNNYWTMFYRARIRIKKELEADPSLGGPGTHDAEAAADGHMVRECTS